MQNFFEQNSSHNTCAPRLRYTCFGFDESHKKHNLNSDPTNILIMFKVKALALATLVQMTSTSAATEFSVDWGEWKSANEGQKGKRPVKSWKKIGDKGACKSMCEEYAEENNYEDHFRCSYAGDDKKCTITASGDIDWEYYSNWKMIKGDPNPPNLIDDDVESVILGVFNAAAQVIETALVTLLDLTLNPMNGGYYYQEDFTVDWTEWKDDLKVKNPVKTWTDAGPRGTCKDLCAQYVEENNYEDHFLCSYQDESPHKCTISADDDTDTTEYTNWKKIKGTPMPPGEYAYPLYEESGDMTYDAGLLGIYGVKYDVKVIECYPVNGWEDSLTLGPYTKLSSDSFISPETFAGKVGVVGEVSMSKLRCSASVSGEVTAFGMDAVSSEGSATVTASGSGDATAIMKSLECDTTYGSSGIELSPDSAEITLKKTEVNQCDIDLKITITGVTIDVGAIICTALVSNSFDLLDIIVGLGVDIAQDEIEDVLYDVNTGCLPVSLPKSAVSTYEYDAYISFGIRSTCSDTHTHIQL